MIQLKTKVLPFLLTVFAVGTDQVSKFFIVKNWPRSGTFIKDVFGNEFLEIYHVRNTAIAFSLGHNLPDMLRPFLFILVPVVVLFFLVVYYFKSDEFTPLQRWSVAGILGGGIGNLIDRIFRPDGVVDFISVNFYGFLGFSRWPTFNFADSFVVVFGLLLLFTIFVKDSELKARRKESAGEPGPEKNGQA
ncbi:MAG: signal peptidase II [Treponema sp.]|jgi:signal peptidase II|nr:signal peptidase II [Treponema sp.]